MFSSRFYLLIYLTAFFARLFGVAPVKMNLKRKLLEYDESGLKLVERNYWLVIFWAVASFTLLIRYYREGLVDLLNLTLAYWLVGILITILYSMVRWMYHDNYRLLNGLFTFMRYVHRVYMPEFKPNTSKLTWAFDIIFILHGMSVGVSYVSAVALLIYDPTCAIFLGALVPKQYLSIPVKLIVITFHAYLLFVLHVCLITVGGTLLIYGCYLIPFYLMELRIGRKKYRTSADLREPGSIMHIYRSLQILQAHILWVVGPVIVIYNAYLMGTCMFCNSVLMRYWDTLGQLSKATLLIWSILCMVTWSFVLEMGRYLFQKGGEVTHSWGSQWKWSSAKEKKLFKKFKLSCHPILLCYGRQFVIKRRSVLLFLRGIVRGTLRTMLTMH